jgi:hypothetical protein
VSHSGTKAPTSREKNAKFDQAGKMMLLLGVALAGGAAFIVPGHAPQLAVRRTEGTAVLPPRALPTASITGRDGVKTGVVSGTIQVRGP